ncbi:NAD(P)-dependent oxidoreductase [Oceanibaculum sp.]|uniref:NAD(P)-dependent oxidoreductase n=1 Tax=Oceanibaculum sp. TaxID=1903597 RepID=UPI002587E050|nr:NAD(P)-dependent oxidoreductase [Oceanibaculum sp.]MCH2394877.1 NAD(P)-dependent oxidoreductase [Oceanibaculum sp.]
MNVALIGATGKVGSRILDELLSRGHTVTAIARNTEKLSGRKGVTARTGDVNDALALATLIKGCEAVISAVPFRTSDPATLVKAVEESGARRYLVVGGAGSLEVAPGVRLIDTPEFPEAYRQEATAGAGFLDFLRTQDKLDWTFLSPSALFVPGERTGSFRLGKDQLLVGEKGSTISFEDFSVALVDELEKPAHPHQRFTVGY